MLSLNLNSKVHFYNNKERLLKVIKIIDSISKDLVDDKILETPLIKCLTECGKGEVVTILSVKVGTKAKRRLANLGVVPGIKILKKKSAPLKGPIEIIVKGTSLVIGRGLASKIMVKCQGQCEVWLF